MKVVKLILKIIKWILISVLGLVILVLVAIQTPIVKKQIVRIAVNQVNSLLNAKLSVGKLNGNFFTNLSLDDVLLTSENNDTIAYINELSLRYSLIPLIYGEIVVDRLNIEKPYVHLEQLSDSSWNFAHITKPTPDDENDTTSSGFNMLIQVDKFILNNGNVDINAFDSIIPQKINDLYIDLSGHYSTNDQKAELEELSFITYKPDLELKKLSLSARGDKNKITLNDLLLETGKNGITAKGQYNFDRNEKSEVELKSYPVDIEEFRIFLPESFHLYAKPEIGIKAEMEKEKIAVDLDVKDSTQGINLQLLTHYLLDYLSDSVYTPVDYDLALNIDKVDLKYWLGDKNMDYVIDGNLNANGKGLDPATMTTHLEANLGNIIVYGNPISKLDLTADYLAGDVNAVIDGVGGFGYIHAKPDVKQIMSDNPRYTAHLYTRNFNLAYILGDKQYNSDITLMADLSGSGFTPDKINANAQLDVLPSEVMGFRIDTMSTTVNFANENIAIDTFFIETMSAFVNAAGNYNLKGDSDLNLEVILEDSDEIATLLQIDSLETSLNIKAHLFGQPDSLNADVLLGIGNTKYSSMQVDTISGTINAQLIEKDILVDGSLQANKFSFGSFTLDSVNVNAETDTKFVNLDLSLNNKDIDAKLKSNINLGDTLSIILPDIWLSYKDYNWQLEKDSAVITICPVEYAISNFNLVSSGENVTQSVFIDGKISTVGEEDLKLDIANLDIAEVIKLFSPDMNITGLFNFNASLEGTAQAPELNGDLNVDNLTLENYNFTTFTGNIDLKEDMLNLNVNIIPQDSGSLLLDGRMPMIVRLDSMQFEVAPKATDSVYLKLLIEQLPLSIVNIILPTDEIKGYVESNVLLEGTLNQPDISGDISVNEGSLLFRKYGINYNTIELGIGFVNDMVEIDTFLIRSRQGTMRVDGNVKFDSELYKGELNTSELKVTFNKFNPVDHKQFNVELSGEVGLNANKDSTNFSGDIVIPEAMVYLPAVLSLLGELTPSNIPKPLLVMELEKDNTLSDTLANKPAIDSVSNDENKLAFLNNLQGTLKVNIPRNTWIKNDDMRFELSGDVELMKHQEYFELFGTIDIVRGQYNLFGKVFVVQSGTITFQGGEELNPILNVEALYTFRDSERNRHDLTINVTGDLNKPEIKFQYEGNDISEGDAISYILFGTNMDALTSGQQNSIGGGLDAASLAGTVASSLISSQLTKLLGNTLNVDYIEFKSNSSFDNASFVVGKYITNKLFVSYEQNIGHIEDKDVARYEMTMEYEIFKFLFFRLTSSSLSNGFDFIFKFNFQ